MRHISFFLKSRYLYAIIISKQNAYGEKAMNSAKHTELISVLKEWGMKEYNIGFREAVIALRDYLSVNPNDKADKCLFGDIALCLRQRRSPPKFQKWQILKSRQNNFLLR